MSTSGAGTNAGGSGSLVVAPGGGSGSIQPQAGSSSTGSSGMGNQGGATTAGGAATVMTPSAGSGMGGTQGTTTGAAGMGGTGTTTGAAGNNGTTTGTGGEGTATGAAGADTGPDVDQGGKMNAAPGDSTNASRDYLRLGDIRLLNNRWGSDELGCGGSQYRVFVNQDGSLGWEFNRPTCGGMQTKPDYPEVEFGIHPFGIGNVLETSPPFSSTALLPLQMKDIINNGSASIQVENLNIQLGLATSWNLNFEFWLSQRNPVTDPNPGVYAEVIAFWGWQNGRWPCEMGITGQVSSGDRTYRLCHQDDQWADGKWRYFQFWVDGGPLQNFSGRVDIKPFLQWLVDSYGYSPDLWLTRIEVGSEIDDDTNGSVSLGNISFEINGTTKTKELSQ